MSSINPIRNTNLSLPLAEEEALFKALNEAPKDVVPHVTTLLEHIKSPTKEDVDYLLRFFQQVPLKAREELTKKLTQPYQNNGWFPINAHIPPFIEEIMERESSSPCALECAVTLFNHIPPHVNVPPKDLLHVLNAIHNIPMDQRADVIKQMCSIPKELLDRPNASYGLCMGEVLGAIGTIRKKERQEVVAYAIDLLAPLADHPKMSTLLSTAFSGIKGIPQAQRKELMHHITPLLRDISKDAPTYQIFRVFDFIHGLPDDLRIDVLATISPSLTGWRDSRSRVNAMEVIVKYTELIDPNLWKEWVHHVKEQGDSSLFRFLRQDPKRVAQTHAHLRKRLTTPLPPQSAMDFSASVIDHMDQLELWGNHSIIHSAIALFIASSRGISLQEQEETFIKHFITIFSRDTIYTSSCIRSVLRSVLDVPQDLRDDILAQLAPHLAQTPFIQDVPFHTNVHCNALPFLPSHLWEKWLTFPYHGQYDFLHIMDAFLTQFPELEGEVQDYLHDRLTQLTNQRIAMHYASILFQYCDVFHLHLDHPVVQLAIEMHARAEILDSRNPFRVYADLKESEKLPTPKLALPREIVGGKNVAISIKGLEAFAKEVMSLTYRDLPIVDGPEVHFARLLEHVDGLEATDRETLETHIANMTGSTLNALRLSLVGDPNIKALLQRGKDHEPVFDYTKARFVKCMEYLASLDNDKVQEDTLLTKREEMLLKLSASIQNCVVGKKEGIRDAYYAFVPSEYHVEKLRGKTSDEKLQPAKQYLFTFFQKYMNSLISEATPLMKELVVNETLLSAQLAHQSLYVKNFIGKRIGLVHSLEFDPYAFCTSYELRARSLKETLEIVFGHITPKTFARAVKADIDRLDLWKPRPIPEELRLSTSLQEMGKRTRGEDVLFPWPVDEDMLLLSNKMPLTGVRRILEKVGVLVAKPRSRAASLHIPFVFQNSDF